jgi:hypothetical protein
MSQFSIKDLAKIIERDSKDATYKYALLRGVEPILVFTCMSDNCDILDLTGIRIGVVCDENRSVVFTGKGLFDFKV